MNKGFNIGGQSYRFATSAENVKYGSGTVKDALDDIKSFDTSGMSEFGKKLYAADEKEFKKLLEISSEGIWDECQTRWQGNAIVTDDTTSHGGKVLRLAGTNLQTASPVEFGGDPFTITFKMKATAQADTSYFRALGQTRSFGLCSNGSLWSLFYGTTSCSGSSSRVSTGKYFNTGWSTNWKTVKFTFNGTTLSLSMDGFTCSGTMTVAREPRRLVFGNITGYIDDFELVDNGVVKSKLNFE